jgi:diketogulonate reductase-like aldo/keto reductase
LSELLLTCSMKVFAAVSLLAGASAAGAIPTVTIGQDVHGVDVVMPLVGAGSWQYNDKVAYESYCKAFAAGYTFVDTANGYGNEKGVGQAIKDCWKGDRKDLFVMTKVPGGLDSEETLAAHEKNMKLLGLDYVDHLMTHYPADWSASPDRATPARRQEEWKALESIYKKGEARSIGISHYCSRHIDDVLAVAEVRPSVNQVEFHIGSGDVDEVIEKCQKEKIYFMSFSPLCGPCDYEPQDSLVTGDLVTSIGKKYNVSGAQVSLRWIVQQALEEGSYIAGVIPKSNSAEHIASNIDLFSFELSKDDMTALSKASKPPGVPGDCDVTMTV